MFSVSDVEEHVWKAIRRTINKFRRQPAYFFTEADITSYLYMCLYTQQLEVQVHGRRIFCVHREYPTNFRYEKPTIKAVETVPSLVDPVGRRGNYDLAVLSPEFVRTSNKFEDVVNKNIRGLQDRFDPAASELVFAIELKYIINGNTEWKNQIEMDNAKMKFALQNNVHHAVNLVFCNTEPKYRSSFLEAVHAAESDVCSVFVQSHYTDEGKKNAKPIVSKAYRGQGLPYLG